MRILPGSVHAQSCVSASVSIYYLLVLILLVCIPRAQLVSTPTIMMVIVNAGLVQLGESRPVRKINALSVSQASTLSSATKHAAIARLAGVQCEDRQVKTRMLAPARGVQAQTTYCYAYAARFVCVHAACGCVAGSFGENLGLGCPVTINGIAEGSIVCHCRSNGTGSCGAALVHGFSATAEATDDNCGGCGSCEDMCAGFNPASSTCSACPAGRVDDDYEPTVRRSLYSATNCGHAQPTLVVLV